MKRLSWATLLAATTCGIVGPGSMHSGLTQTCASFCPPEQLKFIPGRAVQVVVVNHTDSMVLLERVAGSKPVPFSPGQELQFDYWGGTKPNISLVFWDATSLPLLANLSQQGNTLRVEIRPGGSPPGDRAVYILDDGHVELY